MALDKQRILNELGSVMNQLQSADCGCMDKLFTNPGQGNPAGGNHNMANYGGYGQGCCHNQGYGHHHGSYNRPCAGEPYSMNTNSMGMGAGRCNPPKLYADTYNYLNQNLMQPVMKDVYNDLKSLTPANTVGNNPIAGQMGLSIQGNTNMTGAMNYSSPDNTINPMTNMGDNQMQRIPNTPGMAGNHNMMGSMAGMGPQIANMMASANNAKPASMEGQAHGGPLTGPMVIDAPSSPYGQVGVTPLNQPGGYNQAQANPSLDATYAVQGYTNMQSQNQTIQNMHGGDQRFATSQMTPMTNMAQNNTNNQQMGDINSNPAAQQMSAAHRNNFGIHGKGVAKFNEMFPGVMQGLGGNLGFDPMAIAIQMNPANQQQAAMHNMQKIMNGSSVNKPLDLGTAGSVLQPAINGMNAAAASFAQPPSTQSIPAVNQQIPSNQQIPYPNEMNSGQNQQANSEITGNQLQTQQQIYTAVTGNSQQLQQDLAPSQGQRMENTYMPENNERIDENPSLTIIKEPIFPVDTSKNPVSPSLMKTKYFEYNTLGQPVHMLPAKMYHTQEPNLPQTLSPQTPSRKREDMRYSNVRSTVSKTSLMANKPIGKVPSRNQLQHIYNQYKGSQSFTQQNIRAPVHGVTHSEGHIAANHGNPTQQRQAPVEKVGDVLVNNAPPPVPTSQKVEQVRGQIGDAPVGKPLSPGEPIKAPTTNSKLRNGLQDMVYTSYPTSAAWSFHGNNHTPYYPGHRSRHRT